MYRDVLVLYTFRSVTHRDLGYVKHCRVSRLVASVGHVVLSARISESVRKTNSEVITNILANTVYTPLIGSKDNKI